MRFTEPAVPLFIEMEGDSLEILFVISTSQVQGAPSSTQKNSQAMNVRKRDREQSANETPRIKKPMKAAQSVALDRESSVKPRAGSYAFGSMPPPSAIPQHRLSLDQADQQQSADHPSMVSFRRQAQVEPLFLPSSQMSAADEEALRAIGLDADVVDADQLADLLEGEGEEVDFSYISQAPPPMQHMQNMHEDDGMQIDGGSEELEIVEDSEFIATQTSGSPDKVSSFYCLFLTPIEYQIARLSSLFSKIKIISCTGVY